jgi:hypothetical protein
MFELTSPLILSTWLNCTCCVSWDWPKAVVQPSKMRKSEERVPDVILNRIEYKAAWAFSMILRRKEKLSVLQRERTAKTFTKLAVNGGPDSRRAATAFIMKFSRPVMVSGSHTGVPGLRPVRFQCHGAELISEQASGSILIPDQATGL